MAVKRGFSIIELTVVIGLISLLALAMSAIMLSTIVSSNRIRRNTKIKQAGDYAAGQLQSLIRNSRGIISCDSNLGTSITENPDGGTTEILLERDTSGVDRIASGSGVYLTPADLKITNYSLTCSPDDSAPKLVNISFDLASLVTSTKAIENSTLHFQVTAELRND